MDPQRSRRIGKLQLNKETLRTLLDDELAQAVGGNPVETRVWTVCGFDLPTDPGMCVTRSCPP